MGKTIRRVSRTFLLPGAIGIFLTAMLLSFRDRACFDGVLVILTGLGLILLIFITDQWEPIFKRSEAHE